VKGTATPLRNKAASGCTHKCADRTSAFKGQSDGICSVWVFPSGAHRDILHHRAISVANGVKRKSRGGGPSQRRTLLTPCRHRMVRPRWCPL